MLALLAATALAGAPPVASLPRANVLILVVDTLRADALGTYGEPSPTSPRLDALARESVVYERAWSQYTWTLPSFISYTTSRFVRTHGWDYDIGQFDVYRTVEASVPTLAEVLSANGYATNGRYANGHLHESLGFGKGFQQWVKGTDAETIAAAEADLKRWSSDGKPNFLYVHVMNCHTAWRPSLAAQKALGTSFPVPSAGLDWMDWFKLPKEARPARALEYRQHYEAAVWDADASMGRVLDALKASGEAANTVVLFHSDHGEALGDHNFAGHNRSVFEEVARVPLMVKVPGAAPARVKDRVGRLLDIPPTVLDVVGLSSKAPAAWQGTSIYRQTGPVLAVSERTPEAAFTLDGTGKLVVDRDTGAFAYGFDLARDPGEKARIKDPAQPAMAALMAAAKEWYGRTPKGTNDGEKPKVEGEEKSEVNDMLKELGYIE
jgi:arylsulfatase A-like enzyme